jgi:hypothetical protein
MSRQDAPLTVDTEIMGVTKLPDSNGIPRYMVHTKHGDILTGGLNLLDFRPSRMNHRGHPAILTLNSRGHVVTVNYKEWVVSYG